MTLEERMAELEARLEATEKKRVALCDELIALQALVTTALAVIAASEAVPLSAAMDASVIRVRRVLQLGGYPQERIDHVLEALEALREDMGESGEGGEGATCH